MAEEVVGQHSFNFGIQSNSITADFSSSERVYKISGRYATVTDWNHGSSYDPSKRHVDESFDWSAEGRYNVTTKAISEKLDLYNQVSRRPAGSFTQTMKCEHDPWLEAAGPCQSVVATPTGSPPALFVADMNTVVPSAPFSSALTPGERAELNRQFDIFLWTRQRIGPASLTTAISSAPIIISPAHNGYVVWMKSEFVVEPAPGFPGDIILVEFRRLDIPRFERKGWRVPATLLKSGVLFPQVIFGPPHQGPYAMRARIDTPEPGDFSREVRFDLLRESPALIKPKGPVDTTKR